MATRACNKRLNLEYKSISENPPEFIQAHPSESNILEWHYIITGPPNTPYHNGQYWGTLMFPPDYPFAPPTIRMHTPSGRFSPSARLCLSISDFHPKSFNPAWEVSTILIGLLSFMTSEEMTTGSVSGTESERRWYAARSKWWNSTGGGSFKEGVTNKAKESKSREQKGNVKAGDGGAKFKGQWEDLDKENWKWITEHKIDIATGNAAANSTTCAPGIGLRRPSGSQAIAKGVADGGRVVGEQAGWLRRNRVLVIGGLIFTYVLVARLLGDGTMTANAK